jgi:23S rRNA (uracil1939-C5)-methyltransferase
MRARLHARNGRFGFYREATHELCDPAPTGQLLPATIEWLRHVEQRVPPADADRVRGLEISEDIAGSQRAASLDIHEDADAGWFAEFAGPGEVVDRLAIGAGEPLVLQRSARSFFQGNRFLLEPMARHVIALAPDGPVVDLYAGVGLFGLALAARGAEMVTLVEGDQASGEDLLANARPYLERAQVMRVSVETYLAAAAEPPGPASQATVIVDPPRTGLSKEALAGVLRHRPTRIVYVSCDVATLARDTRGLLDAGYEIGSLTGFDLFPNTAHVETVVEFNRA